MEYRLEKLTSDMLADSRIFKQKSQQYMAKELGKSLSTIQNWEAGTTVPKMTDMLRWFNVLGINPLRACLEYVHPVIYKGIHAGDDIEKVDKALLHYIQNVAPERERRELAFCIFGETGSSWSAQLDELTARNHLPIQDRISISKMTVDTYELDSAIGKLRCDDKILPDIQNAQSVQKTEKMPIRIHKKEKAASSERPPNRKRNDEETILILYDSPCSFSIFVQEEAL